MADRMAAEIWIGGKLPRSLLDEFPISDLTLDWDENPIRRHVGGRHFERPRRKRTAALCRCRSSMGRIRRSWRAGYGSTTSRSSGKRRGSTSMIPALWSFAPTCRQARQVYADHGEWCSGHLPRRDREGHAGHGEAGGRQETHSRKTLAGVGKDLPQTEPIHASEAAAFAGL